ncbi:DUF4883 family protein [Clostridium aciditolerans]|uniref:DUF4883 family protein n=1 Tax=Clostridium aciditolerans TaxID=339861 RepID=A0A934HYS4_9CLOT|nr:DUF4883 family protein [Clostridium aciditolerans]MBI6873002.1 DUF4883 family protein [Clostridium aciditolerans]
MKKILISLCTLFIISILLVGCNYNFSNINFNKTKPNNFYYTNILAKNLTLESSVKCVILDTNFYKEKELSKENLDTVKSMLKALNKNNFVSKPRDIPEKPIYKMFFTFNKEKLVINVYSEKYLSVYPWDGNYSMDYIDMSSLPISLNLYNLCKFTFN